MSVAYIVDPVCSQFLGHNYTALHLFQKYLEDMKLFKSVKCVASEVLPEASEGDDIDRLFHYCYSVFMPLAHLTEDYEKEWVSQQSQKVSSDPLVEQSYKDWATFFKKYKVKSTDAIVMPSIDYCSTMGLLHFMKRDLTTKTCPAIKLRFIGVLENASKYSADPKADIFQLLRELSDDFPIAISTETPLYSSFVAENIGRPAYVVPYPVFEKDPLPMPESDAFGISSLGSARMDKGFGELPGIMQRMHAKYPDFNFRFEGQLPPGNVSVDPNLLNSLYCLPRVRMLPESITDAEMRDLWLRTDVALLPYSAGTYRYRGSAILQEALNYGRLVLTGPNTAFADQIRYYNCGYVVNSHEEYVDMLYRLAQTDRQKRRDQALQARFLFQIDSQTSYEKWMS